jgi:hypothetical protein
LYEEKLHSLTESVGGNIQHQRKKPRPCENGTINLYWYRWCLENCSERMHISGVLLKVKVVKYNKQLIRNKQLYSSWTVNLVVKGVMWDAGLVLQVDLHLVTVKQLNFYTKWWWYTDEQAYNCVKAVLYCKLLSEKSICHKNAPNKLWTKTHEVWFSAVYQDSQP